MAEFTINEQENVIKNLAISCLKATENKPACENFSNGHGNVLKDFGVKQVTSANIAWHDNPKAYLIPASLPNESEYIAGARLDIYGGNIKLPIEDAIGIIDDSIYNLVRGYAEKGTGEVCGLWTSKKSAGNGIAFMLIKSAIVVANLAGLKTLFALCSPFTVSMFTKLGFEVLKSVGNEGTFYYPKLDLIATAMILEDVNKLSAALPEYSEEIFNLVATPTQTYIENGSKGEIFVSYNLDYQNVKNKPSLMQRVKL